jgi:hypothetical protein
MKEYDIKFFNVSELKRSRFIFCKRNIFTITIMELVTSNYYYDEY